jgi:hypothetical protein
MTTNTTAAAKQEIEDVFGLTTLFQSYVNKPEITALLPTFLVKGSKNVLVDYAQRVVSRNGFTLYNQANTGKGGIKGSYEWGTSSGSSFSLRAYDHTLEFDWNGTYNTLLTGLRSAFIEFAKVLDFSEQQDVLLFVLGDGTSMRRWSGGVSKVWKSTATTLTKQGVLTAVSSIAFVPGDGVSVPATITDSNNNFLNAGFAAGDILNVSGSAANSSNFTIASVTAGVISLIISDVLVAEAAGPSITMYNQTGPTWKSARFFSTISGRSITYKGVTYTYTGGETTDTLTGLTAFPAVTVGDQVWQTSDTISLPSAITTPFPNFYPNLIGVQLNMVFLASTQSQMVFGSKSTDYTNFTLPGTRAPGDPSQQPLTSGHATCIVPIDTDAMILNVQNTLIFGSGVDAFDQIDFHMSADNTAELLRIIRYKTAVGSGVASKSAICPIKNNTVYISNEPALDSLSQAGLESPDGKKNVPISDPIKNDFDSYDFTNAHVIYWKRALYIALPVQGLVLIYDLQRNLWQPPQTIPVGRFAIINGWLYGHSAVTNETYKLFTGTNDNGVFINQIARFAYNNGGRRDRLKNLSEYWSDGYITANGELDYTIQFGFNGSEGSASMSILGSDASITTSVDANPFGADSFGDDPLGGAAFADIAGLPGANTPLLRFWQVDTATAHDYIEHYVEYDMTTLDGQFAIVAHGSNQWDAGTSPVSHKK